MGDPGYPVRSIDCRLLSGYRPLWTVIPCRPGDCVVMFPGTIPEEDIMIVLGIILLVVGLLIGIHLLFTLGIILIVVGVILELLGAIGHPIGRRHYY